MQKLSQNVIYHLNQTGILHNLENSEVVIPYNESKIRYHSAKKTETQGQRERFNLSARVLRQKKRMLENALTLEYQQLNYENQRSKIKIAQNKVFVNKLLELSGNYKVDLALEWKKTQLMAD